MSNRVTVPSASLTARVSPSGLSASAGSPSPVGVRTPIAAGLRSSVDRRLERVATESSRATPALASRSAWSRRSSLRAWAPSRWASATVAALRAPWRSESAITPATTAAASSTPTPASSVRRRRLVRRWRSASRSLAARLSSRKARSSSLSSGSWLGGPVERRGEPGAAVELGRVAPGVAPLARRRRSGAGEGGGPRRPRRASRAGAATREAAPRGRPRPRPRRR